MKTRIGALLEVLATFVKLRCKGNASQAIVFICSTYTWTERVSLRKVSLSVHLILTVKLSKTLRNSD